MARTVYLNNKDLLKEIHLSKNSYCAFRNKQSDHQYDAFISSLSDLTTDFINATLQTKKDKIKKEGGDFESLTPQHLIFRLYSWEHIPLAPPKPPKITKKNIDEIFSLESTEQQTDEEEMISDSVHVKLNFMPFLHYRLDENLVPYIVAKSHWKGSIEEGSFSKDHGTLTPTLAQMFIRLSDRYASRSNWRNYSYNEEMRGEALVQLIAVGLKFDESKSQNPFSYFTQICQNAFLRVLSNEKKMQNIRDDILEINGLTPSWTRQNSAPAKSEDPSA